MLQRCPMWHCSQQLGSVAFSSVPRTRGGPPRGDRSGWGQDAAFQRTRHGGGESGTPRVQMDLASTVQTDFRVQVVRSLVLVVGFGSWLHARTQVRKLLRGSFAHAACTSDQLSNHLSVCARYPVHWKSLAKLALSWRCRAQTYCYHVQLQEEDTALAARVHDSVCVCVYWSPVDRMGGFDTTCCRVCGAAGPSIES